MLARPTEQATEHYSGSEELFPFSSRLSNSAFDAQRRRVSDHACDVMREWCSLVFYEPGIERIVCAFVFLEEIPVRNRQASCDHVV